MRARPRTHYLCCIPVEGAVTALGYYEASVSITGLLILSRSIIALDFDSMVNTKTDTSFLVFVHLMFLVISALILGFCLILAIVLLVGVKKRRPGGLLTYLFFGLLKVIIVIYLVVDVFLPTPTHQYAVESILALFLYVPCLVMVYFVYRNIKLEKDPNNTINGIQLKTDLDNMTGGLLQEYYPDDIKKKDVV